MADPQVTQLNRLFPVFAVLSPRYSTLIGALVRGTAIGALNGLFWRLIRSVFVYNMIVEHQFDLSSDRHTAFTPQRPFTKQFYLLLFLTIGEGCITTIAIPTMRTTACDGGRSM